MSNITEDQIHAMCNHIQGHCNKCPREIDTVYGRGTQGCFAIAEETLMKAREIAAPVLSEEQREALLAAQLAFGICHQADEVREGRPLRDSSWIHYDGILRAMAQGASGSSTHQHTAASTPSSTAPEIR